MPKIKKRAINKNSKFAQNHLSVKTQFQEALSYLKESKHHIFACVYLFIFSSVVGFLMKDRLSFLDDLLRQIILKTTDMDTFQVTFFIMQNNMQSSFMSIIGGLLFGFLPIFYDVFNGLVLGYVLSRSVEVAGILSFWRLLPHGIFELPAIFISFGLGVKLGFSLFIKRKYRVPEFKRRFYNSINVFLMIIIPLLIIAGIIEGILVGLLT